MTSQKNATSTEQSDSSIITDATAANDSSVDDSAPDNGIDLTTIFDPYFRPDANTIVCGALDEEKVAALAKAGVELVVNLQPDDELSFDESAAVEQAGMY